jgi:hypothetical protein
MHIELNPYTAEISFERFVHFCNHRRDINGMWFEVSIPVSMVFSSRLLYETLSIIRVLNKFYYCAEFIVLDREQAFVIPPDGNLLQYNYQPLKQLLKSKGKKMVTLIPDAH